MEEISVISTEGPKTVFGAVLFDDPSAHDHGWACIHGDAPFRISGTYELTSEVVWLTNLDYEGIAAVGMEGSRFRRDSFLTHGINRLWGEMGLFSDTENVIINMKSVFGGRCNTRDSVRVAFSAWLFHWVMKVANHDFHFEKPDLSDLPSGIRNFVLPNSKAYFKGGPPPTEVNDALRAADGAYQNAARDGIFLMDAHRHRLPIMRGRLASLLLEVPYPVGGWRSVKEVRALTRGNSDMGRLESWLKENPGALLRVSMERTDPKFESLINYGSNINRNALAGSWKTAGDMLWMINYCDFRIHDAILGDKLETPMDFLHRKGVHPESMFGSSREASYAVQIYEDMLWRAMIGKVPGTRGDVINPAAPFIRAKSNDIAFHAAAQLSEKNIQVMGYGSGGVIAMIPSHITPTQLLSTTIESSLTIPMQKPGAIPTDVAIRIVRGYIEDPDNTSLGAEGVSITEAEAMFISALAIGDLGSIMGATEALSVP